LERVKNVNKGRHYFPLDTLVSVTTITIPFYYLFTSNIIPPIYKIVNLFMERKSYFFSQITHIVLKIINGLRINI